MKGPNTFAIFANPTLEQSLQLALLILRNLRGLDDSGVVRHSLKGRSCLTTSEPTKTGDVVVK
jgi:hypothetical protein